jgi:NAD(P)-dependent dehydrogenase (short-subunit alcohol dehydrogenase family)
MFISERCADLIHRGIMNLTDSSVLVTGGAGGFGGATARRLAQMGARVVIADVGGRTRGSSGEELGNGAVYVHTDIMEELMIAEAVTFAIGGKDQLPALSATTCVRGRSRRQRQMLR